MADSPFIWGENGTRLTPEEIVARRKVADAMAAQAADGTLAPGTRGAGGYLTQGLAKIAKSISAGLDYREADAATKANAEENKAMIASLLSGGGTATPAAAVASSPMGAVPTLAAPAPRAVTAEGPVKIYSNDEPSPLDPPSGKDRDAAIRTVVAEAGNQGPVGMNAVASVIKNRAVAGNYGGDTAGAVVRAPNQFEPWNTEAGRAKMAAIDPNSKAYRDASAAVESAYFGNDPTNGAKNFIQPKLQTDLGRPMPGWAQQPGVMIGDHKFIGGQLMANRVPKAFETSVVFD